MQRCNFWSVNKKLYRFCFLPWKSCTFAPFNFGNVQGKCFHIFWSFYYYRSSTSPCPEGSFSAPEIGRLFGDAVGASLVCPARWETVSWYRFLRLVRVHELNLQLRPDHSRDVASFSPRWVVVQTCANIRKWFPCRIGTVKKDRLIWSYMGTQRGQIFFNIFDTL